MLFHSADEMLVMVYGVIKEMTLCKESYKVRSSPPSATYVMAYMVVTDGEPSGTQHPTPDREGDHHLSNSDPDLGGRTQCQLQVNLGDLADSELQQLMEDLCWEVALSELNAPPRTHCQSLRKTQWDTGSLMRITKRSPF